MGPEEGQQEAHDLPEDVPRPPELRPVRRDLQGEEEAHLPVRLGHPGVTAEVSSRKPRRFNCVTNEFSLRQYMHSVFGVNN